MAASHATKRFAQRADATHVPSGLHNRCLRRRITDTVIVGWPDRPSHLGNIGYTMDTSARERPKLVFVEATGSALVLLSIAIQHQFFEKHEVEIEPVSVRGATVPRITPDTPIGVIGEPAAILQAAEGSNLRIVASLSSAPLSGHLVARPGIRSPSELRGKLIGVRVVGAGVWISTMLALDQLGLLPDRDGITTVPVGSPIEILAALERGTVDAALVTVAQSRALQAKGYTALLTDYPPSIATYGLCLAADASYARAHPQVVRGASAALIEALAFSRAEGSSGAVMEAFRTSLHITDRETVQSQLRELRPKPYPSLAALQKMQTVMAAHDPRILDVQLAKLIDEGFVRSLDESGAITRLYDAYGVDLTA